MSKEKVIVMNCATTTGMFTLHLMVWWYLVKTMSVYYRNQHFSRFGFIKNLSFKSDFWKKIIFCKRRLFYLIMPVRTYCFLSRSPLLWNFYRKTSLIQPMSFHRKNTVRKNFIKCDNDDDVTLIIKKFTMKYVTLGALMFGKQYSVKH